MTLTTYRTAPYPVADVLKASASWYVIQPEATTNLITNPSPQVALSGTVSNGIATRVTTQARRGRYSTFIAPSSNLCRHEETKTGLVIGQVYTFSRDVYSTEAGRFYELRIVSGSTTYTKRFRSTGRWQRIDVSGTATQTSIVCTTAVVNHTSSFYIDGAQLEAKAYPTTYCDGNQVGFRPDDYQWAGVAYSSLSTRSALSSHGGRMFNFADFGAFVKAVAGLAYLTTTPITTPLTNGGAVVNAINPDVTSFSLTVQYPTVTSEITRASSMDQLRQLLRPQPLGTGRVQPTMLMYEPQDDCGEQIGDRLWIPCYWEGDPIEQGAWPSTETVYNFTMYAPMLLGLNRVADVAPVAATTAAGSSDATLMRRRRDSNAWSALVSAASNTGLNGIYAIEPRRGGGIYVGSDIGRYFGSTAGVDNGIKGIVQFDGSTWSNVGPNAANGVIRAIATDATGTIYVGGTHTNLAPGSPNIARWDGVSWNTLNSGANGLVRAIAIGGDGLVYVGGDFTTIGGVVTRGIAVYNPSANTFAAMGTGLASGYVNTIAISPRGFVYIGGSFTGVGGVANTANIGVWNLTTGAWESLGNVTGVAPEIHRLLFDTNRNIVYAGGSFSAINGVTSNGLIYWNGRQWQVVSTGLSNLGVVYTLEIDRDGLLYIGGQLFNSTFPPNNNLLRWNGTSVLPADIYPATLTSGIYVQNVKNARLVRATGDALYVAHWEDGAVVTPPPTMAHTSAATITNTSTMTISPIIKIAAVSTGTSTTTVNEIINYTTGSAIYLNTVLRVGETLTINTQTGRVSVVSSLFGSQFSRVLNGSDLPLFKLTPGSNIIGVLANRSDVTVTLEYQEAMTSIDDTIWRVGR